MDFFLDLLFYASIGTFLFLTTYYTYLKVSVIAIDTKYKKVIVIVLGCLIIAFAYSFLSMVNQTIAQLTSYLYPSLFFIIFERDKIRIKSIIIFLSSCITRIILMVPMIIVSAFSAFFNPKDIRWSSLLIYILCLFLTWLLLKIKRFRRGFQFLQEEKNIGLGLVISGVLFVLFGVVYTYEYSNIILAIVVSLGIIFFGFGLYLWIRRSITAHYREKMKLRSEEHYKQVLAENEQKLDNLRRSNEFLAKIVHRDNHLITALNSSIEDYFSTGDSSRKDAMLREIQTLARERTELIDREQRESKILPSTGNLLIDGAINELYIKAAARGIDFNLDVAAPVDEIIGKFLSQTELQTLLCDHIKDAVIAVEAKGGKNGRILVSFSFRGDIYDITVYDSGVDFDPDTLSKLGLERVTTHADSGGSGIGFMTTFDTLRKSYSSLIITEFENKTPFSKSVSFRFDGLSAFVIQSYRAQELKSKVLRNDILIV